MNQRHCPDCQSPLPPDAPEGLCPECLMKAALEISEDMTLSVGPVSDTGEEVLPNPGDQFGEYQIERELGRGGMGAVYEAEQLETGRRVALKVLAHRLDSPEARARFFREGRLAASINHPNSVYVYGTGEVEGTPVIIMELVDGGTLYDRVKQDGPLPVGKAVDAIIDVISGLEAAQAKGILHRDIKPSNCFEDIDGSVKVGDFGLSISSEPSEGSQLISDGLFLGTPAFSSPEQLRGEELNARSDIYSVGVTLFYLLTGRTPFEGQTSVKLVADVLEKAPPSPKDFSPEIPEKLARLVLRCLEKTPGDRFRNYTELHNALIPFGTAAPAPAQLLRRFLAGVIDLAFIGIFLTSIVLLYTGESYSNLLMMKYNDNYSMDGVLRMLLSLLLVRLVWVCYYTFFEWLWGCSWGKATCRLRVVDDKRNTPVFKKALLRAIIFVITPYLPLFIYYSMVALGKLDIDNVSMKAVAIYSYFPILCLLFSTARKHNGLASIHDMLSNTRVVHKPKLEIRNPLPVSDIKPIMENDSMSRIGAYNVLETLRQGIDDRWLLAYDTRLLRKVWIHEVPAGTPELPGYQKTLRRIGRLRWITGRRSAQENWDVFEAPEGSAFPDLIEKPQPWESVRFWLVDLAEELAAAQMDNSVPEVLSLDRIWITAEGRAKLLDFPVPGLDDSKCSDHKFKTGSFIKAAALAALEGQVGRSDKDPLSAPVPLYVRRFLEDDKTMSNTKASAFKLRLLIQRPTRVSRIRRLAVASSCLLVPVVVFFLSMFGIGLMADTTTRQPELTELGILMRLKKPADDRKLSIFIKQRYQNIVLDPEVWNDPIAKIYLTIPDRDFIEQSVKDAPEASKEEIAEVNSYIEEKYFIEVIKRIEIWKAAAEKKILKSLGLAFISMILFVIIPAMFASFCYSGGVLLLLFGLCVVREDGNPEPDVRIGLRSILTWILPVIFGVVLYIVRHVIIKYFAPSLAGYPTEGTIIIIAAVLCIALFSTLLPVRGIPDRLAGTRLVLR